MRTPLAYCTMRVMMLERSTARGYKWIARMHSAHFGLTSALRSAGLVQRDTGRPAWIEGAQATQPGKVRRR